MDFHSMKRKELQALCKKHRIPANLSNLEMASRLSELHKEMEKSLARGPVGNERETGSTNVVVNDRKVKKVRFSPEDEMIEFTRSRRFRRRTRRNSVWNGSLSVENTGDGELGKGDEDSPSRVMQLRVKKLVVAVATVSKWGGKKAKGDDDIGDRKALGNEDDHELVERIGVSPGRITRSRKQNEVEASMPKEKRGRKVVRSNDNEALVSAGNDDDGVVTRRSNRIQRYSGKDVEDDGKGLDGALEDKKIEGSHVMVKPEVLVRRSKRVADSVVVNDDTREHEDNGAKGLRKEPKLLTAKSSSVDEETTVSKTDLDGKLEVVLEQPIEQELRRSNRRKSMMVSQEKLGNVELKSENEDKCVLRSSLLQSGGKTDLDGKLEVVQVEQPIEQELRRSNRRKSMKVSQEKLGNVELKPENEDKRVLRSSLLRSGAAGEASKVEKKVPQPVGGTRRTRRKTLSLKADEKLDIDASEENFETATYFSEPCAEEESLPVKKNKKKSKRNISKYTPIETFDERHEDSAIQQKNETKKRSSGFISGGDVIKSNYAPSSSRQSERRPSKIKKTAGAVAFDKVADERNSPIRSEQQNPLHAALREGFQGIGKSLSIDAELSVSQVAESPSNPGSTSKTSAINISNDVHGKTSRNKPDASIADHGGSTDMKLISSNELGNIEETAHSRSAEFKTGYADCDKEFSASKLSNVEKVHSLLESDMQEMVEKRSSDTDKNEPEPLIFNETEGSSMRNKIDNQVLPDDSDVSDDAALAKTTSSANTLLLEAQTDKYAEPSSDVVDHVGEVEVVSVLEYSGDIHYTGSKSSIHLNEPSSGKLRKSVEGDNKAGGERGTVSRLAETDEDGCLKDKGNEGDDVCSLSYLFDRDSCARITPQDRGINSGKYSATDFAEEGVPKDLSAVSICAKSTKIEQKRGLEERVQRYVANVDENIHLKFSETEGGSSNDQKSKCGEDKGFSVSNLFDAERTAWTPAEDKVIFSDENAINDFGEQGVFDDSPAVAPVSMCKSSEIKQRSGHKANQIAEGHETYVYNNINLESAEICGSGCLKAQRSSKDEDCEFSLSNLFDGERSTRIGPQDKGIIADKYSIEDSNEPGMSFNQARSTMCIGNSEVKFNACSSSSPDPVPWNSSSVSKYQDTIEEKEAAKFKTDVPGDGMPMEKMTRDGENDIFNQADKHRNKDTNEPANPKVIQGQEAWSNGSQTARNAMSTLTIDGKGETNQIVREGGKFEDGVAMSEEYTTSKVRSESNGKAELAMNSASDRTPTYTESSQIWTEVELNNLFGTTEDNAFPTVLNETNSQGTELASLTMSVKESIASSAGSLTKMRKKEMLGETGSECEKSTNDVSSTGGDKAEITMSTFEANNKGKGSQVAQGQNIDEDVNDENCGKDKEVLAATLDVALCMDYTISNVGVESTSKDLLATDTVSDRGQESATESSQNWTDMGLKNLFGTTETNVIATGVKETLSQGTEAANLTMSMYTSKDSSCGCLTKMKKKEEGETGNECKKSTNKDVVLPTNYREVSDADTDEDGLKMFSIPINIVAPNKVEETSAHGGKLDSAVFDPECVGTKKENVVTQSKSGEKVGYSGNDLENNFCPGISLSANGKDTSKELKEVESVQFPGTITVLSGSECDGCEASGEQHTENTCEGVEETVKIMEESKDEMIMSPGLSTFDGCEASGEQQTENTCEVVEETSKILEESKDEMIMSPGLSTFDGCEASGEKQTENTCEVVEGTVKIMEESKDEMIMSPGLSTFDGCEASGEQQTESTCEVAEKTVKIMEESKDEMIMSPGLSTFDGCEASGEQQTDTCEVVEETVKAMEESKDEMIMSPGQSSFDDAAAQNGNESTEMKNTISTGSLRSLEKSIECHDMLLDTELMKDLSCSSEGKMVHNTEAAFGVSDADFQKSAVLEDSNLFTACCEDDNIVREESTNTSGGPVDSEIAKIGSSGQKDVTHKGTPSSHLAKSHVDIDEVAEKKCEKSMRVGGDSCGPKVWDKIDDNLISAYELNELLNSKTVTDPERHSVCYTPYQEEDRVPSSVSTTRNVNNRVPPAEHGTPVYDAETEMLGELAMLFGDTGRSDMEKRESLNLEGDHEKNGKEVVENFSPTISTQFPMQEHHLEENSVNFNKYVSTVSIEPTSVCNEILQESDVADTIKEYMDSVASLSVEFDDSEASRPTDVLRQSDGRITAEDDVLEESQEDNDDILADSEGKGDKKLIETASKQEDAMVFTEPDMGPKKTAQSPVNDLTANEGSTADEGNNSSLCSDGKELEEAKKNIRTILIHGTPKKPLNVADMKENAPMSKSSQNGDFTAFRPAKRRALQDIQWK